MGYTNPVGFTTQAGGITVLPSSYNGVWKQQVGPKTWNVIYQVRMTNSVAATNPGDFVFSLPTGLVFDVNLPFQNAFLGSLQTSSHANRQYFLPGASSTQFNAGSGTGSQFGSGVIVWSASQFRFFITDGGNGGPRAWGTNYWNNADTSINIGFSFQTP
jgi:hypothetical protein